jgi:hypothetical protein
MAAPDSLYGDFDGRMLRGLALSEEAGSVTRRLLTHVAIYEGGTRADAAQLGGVGRQTLRCGQEDQGTQAPRFGSIPTAGRC